MLPKGMEGVLVIGLGTVRDAVLIRMQPDIRTRATRRRCRSHRGQENTLLRNIDLRKVQKQSGRQPA
jgi:hypothetical protein